jgi:dihydroflavonol-4-reductase
MDTILLTGISGFLGKHCAVKLLNAGYAVRGSIRRLDRVEEVRTAIRPYLSDQAALSRLTFVALDLTQDAGWGEALKDVTALMHTASPFPITQPKNPDDLIRPAVDGTLRALRAAKAAGVLRVVLTSSTVAVLGGHEARVKDESDWFDADEPGASPYARSKTLAERAAWAFVKDEAPEMALTVINPGFIVGPPLDGNFGSSIGVIRRFLRGKDPMLPAVGFPIVDVRDVAEMHLRALQRPATAGKRYLAVAGSMWMYDMGRVLKAAYPDRRIPTRIAPKFVLRILALFDSEIRAVLPEVGKMERVSNARAIAEMGLKFIAPEDALRAAAKALVDQKLV